MATGPLIERWNVNIRWRVGKGDCCPSQTYEEHSYSTEQLQTLESSVETGNWHSLCLQTVLWKSVYAFPKFNYETSVRMMMLKQPVDWNTEEHLSSVPHWQHTASAQLHSPQHPLTIKKSKKERTISTHYIFSGIS